MSIVDPLPLGMEIRVADTRQYFFQPNILSSIYLNIFCRGITQLGGVKYHVPHTTHCHRSQSHFNLKLQAANEIIFFLFDMDFSTFYTPIEHTNKSRPWIMEPSVHKLCWVWSRSCGQESVRSGEQEAASNLQWHSRLQPSAARMHHHFCGLSCTETGRSGCHPPRFHFHHPIYCDY